MNRRNIQILGWTLIWSGLFIFGYLGWQLFGTDLVNARVQADAEQTVGDRLEQAREALPAPEMVEVDDGEVVEFQPEQAPKEGVAIGLMRVPRVGLEAVVFAGVSSDTLKKGPGLMSGTPMPGQPGNAVISGHRTTYGRPFFDFDQLAPGDLIEVETAIGLHRYEVRDTFIVEPTDVWVTDDRPGGWLTLTTCNPKFSARERLIITAELVEGPNLGYVEDLVGRLERVG
ncbi:MAG: sortase [Acidimicrobiia bacterium]